VNNNDVPHQAQRRAYKRAEPADRYYKEARRSTNKTDTDKARRSAEGTDDAGDNTKALADTDEETPNHIILETYTDRRVWTELRDDRRVGERPVGNDEWARVAREDKGGILLVVNANTPNKPTRLNTVGNGKNIAELASGRETDKKNELIKRTRDGPALKYVDKEGLKLVPKNTVMTLVVDKDDTQREVIPKLKFYTEKNKINTKGETEAKVRIKENCDAQYNWESRGSSWDMGGCSGERGGNRWSKEGSSWDEGNCRWANTLREASTRQNIEH
jgi:hypothetical protein